MRDGGRVDMGPGVGIAASLLVVLLFVGGALAAVVATGGSRPDPVVAAPQPTAVLVSDPGRSAVLVDATGCRRDSAGSGVVTADGVVTNAHVVAGADEVRVTTTEGEVLAASVGAFDPVRDLALLVVPGLATPPLPTGVPQGGTDATALVRADEEPDGPESEGVGVEAVEVHIARTIDIVSTDIYGQGEHERRGLELAGAINSGDSGGAVIDAQGHVVGIVFSASRRTPDVAYAVSAVEIVNLQVGSGAQPVDTGPCLRS